MSDFWRNVSADGGSFEPTSFLRVLAQSAAVVSPAGALVCRALGRHQGEGRVLTAFADGRARVVGRCTVCGAGLVDDGT